MEAAASEAAAYRDMASGEEEEEPLRQAAVKLDLLEAHLVPARLEQQLGLPPSEMVSSPPRSLPIPIQSLRSRIWTSPWEIWIPATHQSSLPPERCPSPSLQLGLRQAFQQLELLFLPPPSIVQAYRGIKTIFST